MITQWQASANLTAYRDFRFDFLKQVEDTRTLPYLDSKQSPTVGVGFNLRDPNVRQEVFKAMKIDLTQISATNTAALAAEQGYINLLEAAINLSYASGQNNILRPNLDAVMFNRAHDPLLQGFSHIAGRNTFEMNTTEMRTAFDALMPTYENNVNTWLAGIPQSDERAALVSLAYNSRTGSTSLLGNNLRQAIIDDKRAEAWFEIRYNSNRERLTDPASADGIAKRRYYEAEKFSLYSPGTGSVANSDAEAKAVFQMYTAHREHILTYESQFGVNPGGTPGLRNMIAAANTDYALAGSAQVDTLVASLNPAKSFLVTNYAQFAGAPAIDGEILVGSDQRDTFDLQPVSIPGVPAHVFDLSKNDLMLGEGGDDFLRGRGGIDVLYGGVGDDRLVGDAGNDFLFGGAGFDAYVYATGDGHDRIEDSDADGVIFVNGQMLSGGVKKAGHTDWESADGTIKYVMQGTDLVVKLNGTQIMTVIEDFQSGQFWTQPHDTAIEGMAA